MGRGPYSYSDDPAVPDFPDDRPLVLFDGDCALCSGSARKILKHDRGGVFRLAPTQSPLGRALLTHYGVDPDDPYTMLLIQDGRARERSDGVLAIAARLPLPWRLAVLVRIVPRVLRDAAYDVVARRRRRFPGPSWCALPPKGVDMKDRVLG
ncbi:thiol-disulfide oxidoreductase DCC family protein [Brevundimonas sp. SORGH_AS_0993]|uniref:thiol-disulfide oxidoreductase DCC family protein n=1 Tax=Brevundimonas sp. SORGH_AS_0993 TaxID=3041794 RepID=UPI002780A882|nr:DCC1-like thiol-disulfide oxidoreductase family protein [Brevundimonas sp. SORGH_AS_0993]MDQ1154003.1 putative DCC family thiol-disulfide oxidoreductase YuxK [Brevundimonas sp. SORGH_AS_0993]